MPEYNDHNLKITEKVKDTDNIVSVPIKFNTTYIAMQVFQNFPEASQTMDCIDWNYGYVDKKACSGEMKPELFSFTFQDQEEEDDDGNLKEYTVKIADAEKGVGILIERILAGKLHFFGCKTVEQIMELGNWDACVVDACVQCAIFGDVIYG